MTKHIFRVLSFVLSTLALVACGGTDSATAELAVGCSDSPLTWETAAAPYINNYCRGCHSRDLSTSMRAGAPLNANFDSKEDLLNSLESVLERIEERSMPPIGATDSRSEAAFLTWAYCQIQP